MTRDIMINAMKIERFIWNLPFTLLLGKFKFVVILMLIVILPFQNTLNLLLGFSIRPVTLGLLAVSFFHSILTLLKRRQKLYFFEQLALLWIGLAIFYIPVTALTSKNIIAGIEAGIFGLMIQYQGFLAYFVVRGMQFSKLQTFWILKVMLISLTVLVGYGFYEYFWGQYQLLDWLVEHSRHPHILEGEYGYFRQRVGAIYYRSQSFVLEFVSFGYFGYVLSSILFAALALSQQVRKKFILWIALALAMLGLFSSLTLSGIAILLLTICVVGWEAWRKRGNAKYLLLLIPLFAVFSFIVVMIFKPSITETIFEQLDYQKSIAERLQVHIDINKEALNKTPIETLILGRGIGTSGPGSRRYFPSNQYDFFIENEYIGNLAETGFLSLILYPLLMISLLMHIRKITRSYQWRSIGYALGVGIYCVTLGYILIGFSHNVWGQAAIDVHFLMLIGIWSQGGEYFNLKTSLRN
jgi:hypothetical protein